MARADVAVAAGQHRGRAAGALLLGSRRKRAHRRPRRRNESRRPARGFGRQVGSCCDGEPAHVGAGADRARRYRAPDHHPAAGCGGRALGALMAAAEIDAVVAEDGLSDDAAIGDVVRVACAPAIAPLAHRPPATVRTEWVLADLGHDRRAQNGRAQPCRPHRADRNAQARRSARVGHVLRHPPLRRLADFLPRRSRRRLAGSVERRRAGRRRISRGWANTA